MKKILLLISLVLTVVSAGAQTVMRGDADNDKKADTIQDALYIFRNDGGFNAFFFDDIDHFEYSRIDTLGIEHDDYVVQEVHALDSVFRIPLTAIDSVAFVTPETVYKEDVIKANPRVSDYVVASDSLRWIRLSDNVPTDLLPKKGDKWLIEDNSPLLPGGFGGRVTSVENNGNGYTITTEALQPEEAFERAMIKMAVGTQDQSNARTREIPLWGSEEPIELEPISGSASLTGSKDLINDLDIFSGSISPLGSIKYYLKPTLHARSFLSVDPLAGVHIDGYIGADAEIEYAGKVSGTLAARLDVPFPHKLAWFRKVLGKEDTPAYAKVLWKCGLFVEGAGSMELDANYSGTYRTMTSLKYYKPAFGSGEWTGGTDQGFDFDEYDVKKLTLGASFSGGLMLEAAFECFNPLISGISGVGLRAELGRSLSFKIPVTTISDNLPTTYYIDHTYDKLDIDDIVSYSPFILATPYSSMFGWQVSLFERKKFFEFSAGIVPSISDYEIRSNFSGEHIPGEGTASYKMSRKLLLPVKVGFTILDWKDDIFDSYWRPDTYWNFFSNDKVETNFILDPLADEETYYYIFPTVQIPGSYPILCTEPALMTIAPAYFVFYDYKEFLLPPEEGEIRMNALDVGTNIPKVDVSTNADWVTAVWAPLNRQFLLRYKELPKNLVSRECKLHIVGKNSKGNIILEKDVNITQKTDEQEVFTVSPSTLSVPGYSTDFQGGQLTQQITVTYPKTALGVSLASSNDSWLKADGSPTGTTSTAVNLTSTFNVNIAANPSLKNGREASITVKITKADGTTETRTVTVSQAATEIKVELNPVSVILEAEEKEGADYSDTQTVNIKITPYDDFVYSLIKEHNVTPNAEWLEATVNDLAIQIRGEANPVFEDRENTVTYTLTLTTGDVITRTIQVTQLKKKTDEPFTISTSPLRFKWEGGEINVTIEGEGVKRIAEVDFHSISWIGGSGMGLTAVVSAKENPTADQRQADFDITVEMNDGTFVKRHFVAYQEGNPNAPATVSPIYGITMEGKWHISNNGELVENSPGIGFSFTKSNSTITTRLNGDDLHITCTGHNEFSIQEAKSDCTMSFDIIDYKNLDGGNPKISNVVISFQSSSTTKMSVWGVTVTMHNKGAINVGLTNIPVTTGYPEYIKASGTVADGIVFTNFSQITDSHADYSDDTPPQDVHQTFEMVESLDNSMEICVYFETDDDEDDDDDDDDDEY